MKHVLAGCLLGALMALPVGGMAQQSGLTYDQVKREYRRMNSVHIVKCDYDKDGIYNQSEMMCVSSIYQQFYLNGN